MSLLSKQEAVSAQFPMPVVNMSETCRVTNVSGESVQFVVASTNVNDAGSAAGTVIYANLANTGILNSSKDRIGNVNDSSFAFVTGTCLTTRKGFPFEKFEIELSNGVDRATRLAALGALLANGEYFLDDRTGFILGKKATTAASDTAGYSYKSPLIQTLDASGIAQPTVDSYQQVAINLAAGNNQVLVSSAANKQIWVYGYQFIVNAAGTVSFQDEDDVAITGIMPFPANGGAAVSPSGNLAMPIWKLGTNKDLEVDIVTSELDGWLTYAIVSV